MLILAFFVCDLLFCRLSFSIPTGFALESIFFYPNLFHPIYSPHSSPLVGYDVARFQIHTARLDRK